MYQADINQQLQSAPILCPWEGATVKVHTKQNLGSCCYLIWGGKFYQHLYFLFIYLPYYDFSNINVLYPRVECPLGFVRLVKNIIFFIKGWRRLSAHLFWRLNVLIINKITLCRPAHCSNIITLSWVTLSNINKWVKLSFQKN